MRVRSVVLLAVALFLACGHAASKAPTSAITVFDKARNRTIPVLLYLPDGANAGPLVIFSHGKGIKNDEYQFIAASLTARGYAVASIQHDLPGDPPTPNTGNIPRDRSPGWRAQVQSILLVARDLEASQAFRIKGKPILIGHSNGGDASMMAARDFPNTFSAVMSLDNRRFALPRALRPRICSLRSSDQKPDPGVLPMEDEVAEYAIQLTYAQNLRHDDMWDGATGPQKEQILVAIWSCLKP